MKLFQVPKCDGERDSTVYGAYYTENILISGFIEQKLCTLFTTFSDAPQIEIFLLRQNIT
jgi:hypothetical protein